jgi:hypothetical protein
MHPKFIASSATCKWDIIVVLRGPALVMSAKHEGQQGTAGRSQPWLRALMGHMRVFNPLSHAGLSPAALFSPEGLLTISINASNNHQHPTTCLRLQGTAMYVLLGGRERPTTPPTWWCTGATTMWRLVQLCERATGYLRTGRAWSCCNADSRQRMRQHSHVACTT